ncbi:MAG: competence/damage-inducible protein A [Clostridia bacterium]|nr:competence/damage-inducible protein A [Clostridia bacterium]
MNTAEIVCVGTEILIGDIVNTNAAYISSRLAEMGISQYHQSVVGDNPERLTEALRCALERADLVITSGGLGPTYDDLTKETAARLMGRNLHTDEKSLDAIRAYFEKTGRVMSENNAKQALIPDGSTVFENLRGTAPGVCIEDFEKGKLLVMLPGPPRELEPMFSEKVMPYLMKFTDNVMLSRDINIFGMGESTVEEHLRELMENSANPSLAPYVNTGEVRLRVTARAESLAKCEKMCDEVIEKIYSSPVGEYIYGIDTGSLEKALLLRLCEKKLTFASAESCTGGLIGKRMTDLAGASEVYLGSIISYANEVKENLLGVPHEILEKHGAVSPETAAYMARGARERLGVDIAVSTTGIAGPGGGTDEKPVGLVYVGVSSRLGESVTKLNIAPGRSVRDYVRFLAASNALSLARKEAERL